MTPTAFLLAAIRRLLFCRRGHAWIVRVDGVREFLECVRCLTRTPGWAVPFLSRGHE